MENSKLFFATCMAIVLFNSGSVNAQSVKITNGPEIKTEKDKKTARLLDGDAGFFYAYTYTTKGKGTSFFIDKYDKKTLNKVFTKEVDLGEGFSRGTQIVSSPSTVYCFKTIYNTDKKSYDCVYQTVSSKGMVSAKEAVLKSIASSKYDVVEYDVTPNPERTKAMFRVSFKDFSSKEPHYVTEFSLLNLADLKPEWTKKIDGGVLESADFVMSPSKTVPNFHLKSALMDSANNYSYVFLQEAPGSTKKNKKYFLKAAFLNAVSKELKVFDLPVDGDYSPSNMILQRTKKNELVIGGFIKDEVERKGKDLVKCGIFSFVFNLDSYTVTANPVKFFDDKMLADLEATQKLLPYFRFYLDYIIPVGEEVFYIGQQYGSSTGSATGVTSTIYRDVIIAKTNAKGEFEWVENVPLRNKIQMAGEKPYFAYPTENNIFIFNIEFPSNLKLYEKGNVEGKDLKSANGVHGTNFTFTSMSTKTGKMTHKSLFENSDFGFNPFEHDDTKLQLTQLFDIYVPGTNRNEIIIFTDGDGGGKGRFCKLTVSDK